MPRWARAEVRMKHVIAVNDVLDGRVALDIECLGRIYLNAYVPTLQTSSPVVACVSGHRLAGAGPDAAGVGFGRLRGARSGSPGARAQR